MNNIVHVPFNTTIIEQTIPHKLPEIAIEIKLAKDPEQRIVDLNFAMARLDELMTKAHQDLAAKFHNKD